MERRKEKEFTQRIKAKVKERRHTEGREEYSDRYELGKTIAYKNKKKYNRKLKHKKNGTEIL